MNDIWKEMLSTEDALLQKPFEKSLKLSMHVLIPDLTDDWYGWDKNHIRNYFTILIEAEY